MNVNNLKYKDADTMFSQLKSLASAKDEEFLNELQLLTGYYESEAMVNTRRSENGEISQRMFICAQNATRHIVRGDVVGAIHEIWDIIDYHDQEDELTTVDIVLLSLLLDLLNSQIHNEDGPVLPSNKTTIGGMNVYFS